MEYVAVLDISSVVWDPEDYEKNTHVYYKMKNDLIEFIDIVKKERPEILMRSELLMQMLDCFPYSKMPDSFYEFGNLIYTFLADIGADIIQYDANNTDLISIPDLKKPHFNATILSEIDYQLSEMHNNSDSQIVYFTFRYLWEENIKLVTKAKDEASKEYETIVADEPNALSNFFGQFHKVFEHNPKHHEGNTNGNYISRLSCFDGTDNTIPQQHLDGAFQIGKKLFAYDDANGLYVVFIRTGGNVYHAHDEINLNKIPAPVRRKFNK